MKIKRHIFALFGILVLLLTSSCDTYKKHNPFTSKPLSTKQQLYADGSPVFRKITPDHQPSDSAEGIMQRTAPKGSGQFENIALSDENTQPSVNLGKASNLILPKLARDRTTKAFEVDFQQVSLKSIIDFMFQEYIKHPFTIREPYTDAQVNWRVSGEYNDAEILALFETFMNIQGLTVHQQGKQFVITQLLNTTPSYGVGLNQTTQLWLLKNIRLREIEPLLSKAVSNEGEFITLNEINTLIVSDKPSSLEQLNTLIRRVDISPLQGKTISIYTPKYLSPKTLVVMLQNLPAQASVSAETTVTGIDADVIEGTNRVVIVNNDKGQQKAIAKYITEIDQPSESIRQVFHYKLRNQQSGAIADTVRNLLSSLDFPEDMVTINTHNDTNSLLVTATAEDYFEVKRLVDSLDYDVPSTMIDATIVEVSLNNSLAYGVEWFLSGNGAGTAADLAVDLNNVANIPTPAASLGVVSLSSSRFATIELLATETNVQILSRPRVLVKNKSTAEIRSTDEVRVLKTQLITDASSSGTNLPQNEFEERIVGITLEVTPQIADDGTITMVVNIEDSRQGPTDNSSGVPQPTFNTRQVSTEFLVGDQQTVMIGGLIQKTQNRSKTKVPFFGDLPILGDAFQNRADEEQRTELIVFITPYIVRNQSAARMISEAFSGIDLDETDPEKATSLF